MSLLSLHVRILFILNAIYLTIASLHSPYSGYSIIAPSPSPTYICNNKTCIHGKCVNDTAAEQAHGSGLLKLESMAKHVRCNCHNSHWIGQSCNNCTTTCVNVMKYDQCYDNGTCKCNPHWTGSKCNVCDFKNCSGHGHCSPTNGTCICTDPFYWGNICSKKHCNGTCFHSGKCLDNGTCTCISTFTGPNCETCKRHCQHGKCNHNGTQCICPKKWTGEMCDICAEPCNNGTNCSEVLDCNLGHCLKNGSKNPTCICPKGWLGIHCRTCGNGMVCQNGKCEDGQCKCFHGFGGVDCSDITVSEMKILSYLLITSAIISVFCCSIVLAKRTEKKSPVFVWRCISDLGFCLQLIVFEIIVLIKMHQTDGPLLVSFEPTSCKLFGSLTQFFLFSSLAWSALLSFDYYKSVSNPFQRLNTRMIKYHCLVWPLSFCTSIFAYIHGRYRPGLHLCWSVSTNGYDWVSILCFEIWLVMAAIFSSVILFLCWLKQQDGQFAKTLSIRKKMLSNQRDGVILFTLFWTIIAILWEFFLGNSQSKHNFVDDQGLRHAFTAILPLFGCLHIILWWLHNGRYAFCTTKTKILLFRNRGRTNSLNPLVALVDEQMNPQQVGYIDKMLRLEFIERTTQGIKKLSRKDVCVADVGISGYIEETLAPTPSSLPWIFKYVGLGISQAIRIREYDAVNFRKLRKYCYDMSNSEYVSSLVGTGENMTQEMAKLFSEGGASGAFFYFSADGRFIIKTVRLYEKRNLIQLLEVYASHLLNLKSWDENEKKDTQAADFTLINHIYGLYSIKMYGIVQYFVVMENVLWTRVPIHERYDLKGAWINRYGNQGGVLRDNDLKRNLKIREDQAIKIFIAAWRDVSFLEKCQIMDYSLLVGIHFCSELRPKKGHCSALENDTDTDIYKDMDPNDTKFRCRIQRNSPESSPSSSQKNRFKPTVKKIINTSRSFFGGCSSTKIIGPGIYYLGIIDILQDWNNIKYIESKLKGYVFGYGGQSSINPTEYAQRFLLMLLERLNLSLCVFRLYKEMEMKLVSVKSKDPAVELDPACLRSEDKLYLIQVSYRNIQLQNWETWETLVKYNCDTVWLLKPDNASHSMMDGNIIYEKELDPQLRERANTH